MRATVSYRLPFSVAYLKKPGRGWHGRTVELERTLGVGNGSRMDPALFPTPRVRSSGRSREVARVQASFPRLFYGCSYMFHLSGNNRRDSHFMGS